ncbi:hypothetical protein MOO47_07350 [Bombilactobacillus thymidiniphilus]|uniref:Pore-forming protein n=1 Tax=Bombilactobacillus thymidiniphilus TaxID=2923363 RepID=A0ABY4PD28_9LACO|nr:hypothetical protein MOO47_07350 [Bombilactobacillus thymidiniphilus]
MFCFFIAGIMQLESETINYWAIALFVIAIILASYILLKSTLTIDAEQKVIVLQGILPFSEQKIDLQQVQTIDVKHFCCSITFKHDNYLALHLLISSKAARFLADLK